MEFLIEYLSALNPITVAVATVAMVIVRLLWLSHLLFGRAWIRLSGIRPGDRRASDVKRSTIVSILTAIVAATVIGMLSLDAHHTALFAMVGVIWLFIMLEQLNGFIFRREPFALFLLVTTRTLASLQAAATVFVLWS